MLNIVKRMRDRTFCIVTIPNGYGPWELKNQINPITYLSRWNWLRHGLGKLSYDQERSGVSCHFYTINKLVRFFSKFNFRLILFGKSDAFLSIFRILRKNSLIANVDIKIADLLPYWLASGWYFVFELDDQVKK